MSELRINGKISSPAPLTLVVAPFKPIPNLPPGYQEVSRWTDGTGTTAIRCWPADVMPTHLERKATP